MSRKKGLLSLGTFICVAVLLVLGIQLLPNTNIAASAETDAITNIAEASTWGSNYAGTTAFTFVATSDTECSVRLADKSIEKAIVPEKAIIEGKEYKVTSIAGNGFASASNLTKVRLPKSIKTIGNSAFANCQKLMSITLNSVESIGTNAFNLCTSLSYLILPKTVTTVAPTILRSCNTKVYVRVSETEMQNGVWADNWNGLNANQNIEYGSSFTPEIEYVEAPQTLSRSTLSSVNEINGYYVDDYQPFMEERQDKVYVYIPATYEGKPVLGIKDGAFTYNTIDHLTIGYAETPIHIDSYVFNGLIGQSVTINRDIDINVIDWQGNNTVAEYLFADSTLQTILLPNTIESIGPYMFNGCASLKDIGFIKPTAMTTKADEENIVNNYISTGIVNLPSSLINIYSEAFSSTNQILEIYIPKSVTNVGTSVFVGWKAPQLICLAYDKESDLSWDASTLKGWNPNWKSGCGQEVIQFSGEYKISYTLNGGSHVGNPERYTSREEITLKDATRNGYTFDGWYTDASFNGDRIYTISKGTSGDLQLFAKWNANQYEIIYHANKPTDASENVTGLMLDTTCYFDTSSELSLNTYALKGWTFTGWNTQADGSGITYQNEQSIYNLTSENNATISLYAQWRNNNYTVIYHNNKPNGASGLMTGNTIGTSHKYDQSKVLSLNGFALTGWTFNGWNTQADGQGQKFVDGQNVQNLTEVDNGAVTLFAQWTPNGYSIIYASNKPINASQPLEGATDSSTHIYDNNGVLTSNGFSLMGWIFNGWNTQANGSGTRFNDRASIKNLTSINNQIVTLFAQWTPIIYSIEYIDNKPSGASNVISGSTSNSIHTFDVSSKLTRNGYVLPGWEFVSWNTKADGTGTSYADNVSIQNMSSINGGKVTLYASWNAKNYIINYNSNKPQNASGILSGQMNSTPAIYENSVVLATNLFRLDGWSFKGWNTKYDGTGDNFSNAQAVLNITTQDEITLYAQWTPNNYEVVYVANKPSISSQALTGKMLNSQLQYDTPSSLRNIGYSMRGYEFLGWSTSANGSVVYSNGASISLGPNQGSRLTLYAIWDVITYTVWGTNTDTGVTRAYTTYTVEKEVRFTNRTSLGYDWNFSINLIPKGSIGDVYMNYTHRPITYYIVIEFIGNGKTLSSSNRYAVKYDEHKTITAPDFSGYNFKHFAHLKDGVILPPLGPGEQPNPEDIMDIYPNKTTTFYQLTMTPGEEYVIRAIYEGQATISPAPDKCVAEGTLITLADGTQKAVEDLIGTEKLLVWNLYTGTFDTAPILFVDSDPMQAYEVIELKFSDGTIVKVIDEHGFWDIDLNQYVFLRKDAANYIGHHFNKQTIDSDGNMIWTAVTLTDVSIAIENTTAWSPVTYGHLCYYVNGMLSMPGATTGLINIFDVDPDTMKINQAAFEADIAKYGMFTYEEFAAIYPVPEIIFEAFGGQYLKVAIGKGILTEEMLRSLIAKYSKFFDSEVTADDTFNAETKNNGNNGNHYGHLKGNNGNHYGNRGRK